MENECGNLLPAPDPNEMWLEARIATRADLRFEQRSQSGNHSVVVEDPLRGKFYQIGLTEFRFLKLLNGERTVREAAQALEENGETAAFTLEQAVAIAQWTVNSNLVHGTGGGVARRLDLQAGAISRQKMLGMMNPICFRISLFNPNQCLTRISPYCQWLFSRMFVLVWMVVGCLAGVTAMTHWTEISTATVGILSGMRWVWLLLIWVVLKVIHEIAHGIACKRYGGEVPDSGVLILLFTPMPFVNVTSSWRFASRWHRIVVAAAGMYVELFVSFVALIIWSRVDPGVISDICFNTVIMASLTTVLFNANPLMRFDGYYMLSDLVGVPNLYPKGTRWFGDRLKSLLFGVPRTPNLCQPKELRKVAVYGSMAFCWKLLVSVSLVIGASVMLNGLGILLGLFGVGLWFGLPLYRQMKGLWGSKAKQPASLARTAMSGCVMLMAGLLIFGVLKGPATKSAPAIVQFSDESILRAGGDGFVKQIFVADGDAVHKGQPLLELENRELKLELVRLEKQLDAAKIQARIYRESNELSLANAEADRVRSLEIQLAEKEQQADEMFVKAPKDGFVFQRELENQIGNFVRRGEPVLHFANQNSKEVVVSIDQVDLPSIRAHQGKPLRVMFPGLRVVEASFKKVDTKGSTTPAHPSLCANYGGPLVVQSVLGDEDQEADVRLLSPRFNLDLDLPSEVGQRLFAGQRGRAFFATQRQSLGAYLYLGAHDWLEKKIKMAMETSVF